MDELKAWLQQKLEGRLYKKLTEENINALHQAGYDKDLLGLASRESLLDLKLPLAIVDMLLAKCGAAAGPGSQSTGAGGATSVEGASTSAPAMEHLRGQHASADAQPPITMAALKEALTATVKEALTATVKEALEGQAATMKQALEATVKEALPDNRAARHFPVSTVDWNLLEQSWAAYLTEVPTKKKVS